MKPAARLTPTLALLFVAACGGNSRAPSVQSPAGPTLSPHIVATWLTTPLEATVEGRNESGSMRYRVAVHVQFRETNGEPAWITRIRTAVVTTSDRQPVAQTIDTDLALPPSGTVTFNVTHTFEPVRAFERGVLRLSASAISVTGEALEIGPIETPLALLSVQAPPPETGGAFVFVGAGDIAFCDSPRAAATSRLLDTIAGTVFTLGDHAYPAGTAENFRNCYEPTWGRHKARTRAAPGNHDRERDNGAPYFAYFGDAAGPAGRGYYSFNIGAWHIISLNSNAPAGRGSSQFEWLDADLATYQNTPCILAYWHHPVFTSGPNGSDLRMRDAWRRLYDAGADVALAGHEHLYERFAPQDAAGRLDQSRGIRQFTVGTGGVPLYQVKAVQPNSEVRETATWGVLKLTLRPRGYDWQFVPIAGQSFGDSGSASCVP